MNYTCHDKMRNEIVLFCFVCTSFQKFLHTQKHDSVTYCVADSTMYLMLSVFGKMVSTSSDICHKHHYSDICFISQ